ncbi:MAG: tetratricopeptide repeat protein [Planctomycetota bacterium]|jgi:tetratricopeptide (TPR) repeat protein
MSSPLANVDRPGKQREWSAVWVSVWGSHRRLWRVLRPVIGPAAVVLLLSLSGLAATELPRDNYEARERYFGGLRDRGLFSLAETVCMTQLERRDLTLPERTAIVVELSRTFAAHAAASGTFDEQIELLQRARLVIDDLLAGSARHPQRVVLEAQSAFVAASEVELLRWQHELSPLSGASRQRAIVLSDGLLTTFDDIIERIAAELRNRSRTREFDRLSPFRMRGLKRVAEYRLAMMLLDRARLFDRATADQAEALLAAKERLRDLAGGDPNEFVTQQSQLGLIMATRLSGDLKAALRLAEALLADKPSQEVVHEAIAEQAETLLSQGNVTSAADVLRNYRRNPQSATGRLLSLNVRVLMALSDAAAEKHDELLATELRDEAVAFAARAQFETPGYWAQRSRRLVHADEAASTYGPEAAPLIEKGRAFYAAGQIAEAIDAYRIGWNLLLTDAERSEQAAETGYTLGSLLLNEQRYAEANEALQKVAEVATGTPRAAQADFLRLFALARLYQSQPSKTQREAYTDALENHRRSYPEATSFGDATWMLARLQELRLQTTQALQLYTEIPGDHQRHDEATVAIARCGETILTRLRKLDKPRSDWESAIMAELAPRVRPLTNGQSPLSVWQLETLLRTARLLLSFEQPDFGSADRLLDRVIAAEPVSVIEDDSIDEESSAMRLAFRTHQRAARSLKVVSLAGTGSQLESRLLLDRVGQDYADSLAEILNVLSVASTAKIDVATRAAFGHLQVRAMELSTVDLDTLPIDRQVPLRLALADAHEQSGMAGSAARELAHVAAARPDDRELQRRLARLQLASGERELIAKARTIWRSIESQAKAGSDAWMEARHRVIECCIELDDTDEAAKLLKITRLLYPKGGSLETREALAKLAEELQSP